MTGHATAPDLAYVALVVDDPQRSAALFEQDFGLPRQEFSCAGSTVPVITVGASALALAVNGGVSKGLDGKAQIALLPEATGGVRVRFTQPLELAPASSDIVERIDHIGVASADNRAARAAFIDKLGCVYESQQTDSEVETISENFTSDTYNYIFHTRPSQLVGSMRVTFITIGDCEFEFIQDLTTNVTADEARHDAAGNTRGGHTRRWLASHCFQDA